MDKVIKIIKEIPKKLEWDEYFMTTTYLISQRSSCDRLHVGCIIVYDKRIIATGYNGHISGSIHDSFIRDGHEQLTIHAEMNAIADAAKRGISVNDSIAYITHMPCVNCAKILIAAGIKEIIYAEDYNNDEIVKILCDMGKINLKKYII
jgi:dCMP deaminase